MLSLGGPTLKINKNKNKINKSFKKAIKHETRRRQNIDTHKISTNDRHVTLLTLRKRDKEKNRESFRTKR